MVEGPGATRNGCKVQPVVGLVLRDFTIQKPCGKSDEDKKKVELEGRRLESAFSVGKEVFLLLGPVCFNEKNGNTVEEQEQRRSEFDTKPIAIRLHFGMNGVLTVRKLGGPSRLSPWRRNDKSLPKCTIKFSKSDSVDGKKSNRSISDTNETVVIETVSSTCTVVSSVVARSKLNRLQRKDVCADATTFEPELVLEDIFEKRSTAMVCDAILDQERFPGVGNIIKIEGLHKAGVHPRRLVETLSREELKRTILECRAYAMGWLSTGRAPAKQVYNRTKCGSCNVGRVRMVKMGKDLSRVTFWCEKCQPFAGMDVAKPRTRVLQNKTSINVTVPEVHAPPVLTSCFPQHGSKTVVLRRVRKAASPNINRLFRTCKVQGCPYFSWADSHLPLCGCHIKTILRVSKTERTGGRWFLSCAAASSRSHKSQKSNGCAFFQWVTPGQMAPLQGLSPLS